MKITIKQYRLITESLEQRIFDQQEKLENLKNKNSNYAKLKRKKIKSFRKELEDLFNDIEDALTNEEKNFKIEINKNEY
jgi:predicted metal-dependent hydrolase